MRGIQDSEAKEKETERYLTAAFEGILICQILVPSMFYFLLISTNQTLRTSTQTRAIVFAKDNNLDRWALRNSRF